MREFICECCGEKSESDRPEEDVVAESKLLWGEVPDERLAAVCGPCFDALMAWAKETGILEQLMGIPQ